MRLAREGISGTSARLPIVGPRAAYSYDPAAGQEVPAWGNGRRKCEPAAKRLGSAAGLVSVSRNSASVTRARRRYFGAEAAEAAAAAEAAEAPEAAAYFLRNLSTRPAVSTIFCLPV